MTRTAFVKVLSANDVGATGAHMGGILIPKGNGELLAFLPKLDASVLNPSEWIECETSDGEILRLRFVYYNNKMHSLKGTRNEYRITHLTKFLRSVCAKEGDAFEISKEHKQARYRIRVIASEPAENDENPIRIRITKVWKRTN